MAKRKRKATSSNKYWSLVVAAIAIGIAGILLWPKSANSIAQTVPVEVLSRGENLFQSNCASCHGDKGQGHKALKEAPALNGSEHSWHHADSQVVNLIRNGGINMPAVGKGLSDEDIEAIMLYYKQWWGKSQLSFQQKVSQKNP